MGIGDIVKALKDWGDGIKRERGSSQHIGRTTMGTWIKCTDERGQIIYVNIDNAITILRNEAQHRGTVIAFMGASDPIAVRETPEDILKAAKG
ncbi:MAG TPA: hypothetical protein VLZ74_11150 [Methylocella sp.]|nr:hypothetical protein [Methylocella sp.]